MAAWHPQRSMRHQTAMGLGAIVLAACVSAGLPLVAVGEECTATPQGVSCVGGAGAQAGAATGAGSVTEIVDPNTGEVYPVGFGHAGLNGNGTAARADVGDPFPGSGLAPFLAAGSAARSGSARRRSPSPACSRRRVRPRAAPIRTTS